VKRLFVRTLVTVLAALVILIAVMAVASVIGFRGSLEEWREAKTRQVEEAAGQILLQGPEAASIHVPGDVPLFVYNADRELVFSNRGEGGRRRGGSGAALQGSRGDLVEVRDNGELLGYYRSGEMGFENDAANQRFIDSLRLTVWLGLPLALLVAVPFALLFSRSLSRPAVLLARGLERIAHGDLSVRVAERGTEEISLIARSTNRLGKQLEREREMRRQWVQDIVHDLRTPIAAMRAQFEGIRDGVLDLSQDRIQKSLKELLRVETLVADLQELMRLESPEMTVSIEEIESADLVGQIRGRFAAELTGRQIQFESDWRVDRFRADPVLVQRALTNFFANALRHTPREGTIELSIQASAGGKTSIALANSGDPIPEVELERVFDRLYRGDYARSSPGSGLGLTIAKRIAELHGGTLSIRNRAAGGVIVEMNL
jgi:two-component system sensor histidine kinase BaeS